MNNNQNVNNMAPNGMLNNNVQPNPEPAPVDNTQAAGTQSNVVTLGTVSNTTYADTIGDINYNDSSDQNAVNNGQVPTENFMNNNYNETSINDLNVEGTYNHMNVVEEYINDPKVIENINPDPEKKKTITIGKEMKTFILIAGVLLLFIFLMPVLLDVFNWIRFG